MEFEGEPRLYGACNLLGVPGPSSLDVDSDEGDEVIGIRPKSSPQPRRRSSVTDEDSEPEPPLSGSRRVSFADTKGLSLVQVKEFDTWDVPKLPGYDSCEGDNNDPEEYYISTLTFTRPLPNGELLAKVWDQKVELETVELLPGTTILKGVIRVLNISFPKAVYIRTTFDAWSNYFDLLAEYTHRSGDDLMDYFSFKITLVPPFGEQGARVDFCVRYETPAGTFWANNNCRNYVLFCHQRTKDVLKKDNVNKKSCLKTISQNYSFEESIPAKEVSSQNNNPTVKLNLEEEVNTSGAKNTTDSQSETSLKGGTKLVGESRRFSSQRNARKAARMARVRDHFAQRSSGDSDVERDESTPEAKQAEEQENVQRVPSYTENSSSSELCNSFKSPADVLHNDLHVSEMPEDAETSTEGGQGSVEMDTKMSDNLIHLNKEAEGKTERQDPHRDVTNNAADEPVDGAISTGINESLCGQNNNTFGTVVAPLYNQMYVGKVGSESQKFADWNDNFKISKSAPDLTQSHFIPERKERRSNNLKSKNKKVRNSQKCSPRPRKKEEMKQRSESLTAENIVDSEGNKQSNQKGKNTSDDPIPLSVNGETQIRSELQNHSLSSCSPTGTDENNAVTQCDSPKAMTNITIQFSLCQQNDITSESNQKTSSAEQHESHEDADTCENKSKSNINASLDTHFGQQYDLNTEQIKDSAAKAKDFSSPVTCEDTQNKDSVREKSIMNKDEIQCQVVSEVSKQVDIINSTEEACNSEMIETVYEEKNTLMHEGRLDISVQEDLVLENTACVKNWETLVEEEEDTVITDCEKSDLMSCEIDQIEQMENVRTDAATEEKNTTQQENKETAEGPEKATAAEVKDSSAEVAVALKYKERVRKKAFGTINNAKEAENKEKNIQVEKPEKPARVKKQVDKNVAVKKKTEQNKEQILTEQSEMPDVVVGGSSFQEMEATGMVKNVEIHLNNGNTFSGLEDKQEKHEEKTEEDQNFINGFNFNEVKMERVDLESNWRPTEEASKVEKHSKDRLDLTPIMVEDLSHAQVTGTEDSSFKGGLEVDEPACIPPEIILHKEADILINQNVMSDCSQDQVVSYAAEPQSRYLPQETDSDHASYGSESAESDSDDEVELYMHCLRAVHSGSPTTKDKGTHHSYGKRGSMSRNKQLPVPMPAIKESLDEEPQQNDLQDSTENTNATEIQHDGLDERHDERNTKPVSWWNETFSCSNISKFLLFSTLLFVFVVVAYHYDFLACFGLYLISLVWLCCQKETPSMKKR